MIKLPEPITETALKDMLKDRRYWTTWHPEHREYVAAVTEGYRKFYSGPLKYNMAGNIIGREPIEQVGGPDTTVQVDAYTQTRDGNTVQVSAHTRGAPGTGGVGDNSRDKKDRTILSQKSVAKSMAFIDGPIRIRSDGAGNGEFGASRKTRDHNGVDIEAKPHTLVTSPVDGEVIGITNTYYSPKKYNGEFKSIKIKDKEGFVYVMAYVKPESVSGKTLVREGSKVKAGQSIGTVQDRARFDQNLEDPSQSMINHVHFEVRDSGNDVVNPMPAVRKWQNNWHGKDAIVRSATEASV